jgi:hypothetical protein
MKKREKAGSALIAAAALTGLMAGMVFAQDKTDTGASADDSTKTSTKKPAAKHSCKGKKTTKTDAGKSSCKGKSSCSSK